MSSSIIYVNLLNQNVLSSLRSKQGILSRYAGKEFCIFLEPSTKYSKVINITFFRKNVGIEERMF